MKDYFVDGEEHLAASVAKALKQSGSTFETATGLIDSVFSSGFSNSPRVEMYRAWVHPDLYPNERQAVLKNWSDEDIEMYCGTRKGMNDRG